MIAVLADNTAALPWACLQVAEGKGGFSGDAPHLSLWWHFDNKSQHICNTYAARVVVAA